MNVTTARLHTPVTRHTSPAPREEEDGLGTRCLDTLQLGFNVAMISLPGAIMGGGIGVGATAMPALLLGGRAGAALAGGAGLLGAAVGSWLCYSISQID